MWSSSASLPIALAVVTFAACGLCLFAHESFATRKRLRHRVELFVLNGRPARAKRRRGVRAAEPSSRFMATTLQGDELEFARRLQPLDIPPNLVPRLFFLLRLAAGLVLGSSLLLLEYRYLDVRTSPNLIGMTSLGAVFGWSLPHLVADRLALQRTRAVARGLADAIELLVIAVEAGLSLEEGINRIVGELMRSQPAMAQELALTGADLRILPNRDDALHRLAARVNIPSVHSVVTTLSQTLRYGTPLTQALRVVAAELRDDDLVKIEEQANRMPVLLTIPMIVFILPSIFLIIGGPAFLKVLDAFIR